MIIPNWLSSLTGAQAFANNAANGFQPTIGDALQGIGHSMMEYQRAHTIPGYGVPKTDSIVQPGVNAPPTVPLVAPAPVVPAPIGQAAPVQFSRALPAISIGQLANTLFK